MVFRLVPFVALASLGGCGPQGSPPAQGGPATAPKAAPVAVVSADQGLPDPVARWATGTIPLAELDEQAAGAVAQAEQALYEARKGALDQIIADKVVAEEAKSRGMTNEALLAAEVDGKVAPPGDEEITMFYEKNKARIQQPLEVVKDQVSRRLMQQKQQMRYIEFVKELRKKHGVEVFLAGPRFAVSGAGEPRKGGTESAPVQIVEFSDFQCPYCSVAEESLNEVQRVYGDKVSITYRHFPLDFHENAHPAAQASDCAHEQGKFWEFHKVLFEHQRSLAGPNLIEYAGQVGLDVTAFRACFESGKYKDAVDKDMAEGSKVGMSGTPGFYINGRMLSGAQPFEAFAEVIDQELAAAGQK